MNICQSCGMPLTAPELYGKNKDGSKNSEYCIHCYPEGEFTNPNETFEEMVESCVPFMMKDGYSELEARNYLNSNLKGLNRWQ